MKIQEPEPKDDWQIAVENGHTVRRGETTEGDTITQMMYAPNQTRIYWVPTRIWDPRKGEFVNMMRLSPTGYKWNWLATWWLFQEALPQVDMSKAPVLSLGVDEWDYARESGYHVLSRGGFKRKEGSP